jgi:hypothetical protein
MCIEADAQKTTATTKKPVVVKPSDSSPLLASKSSPALPATKHKQKNRECDSTTPPHPLNFPKGGRRTQNSLSAPTAIFDDRLPPPNTEVRVPPPPSRSPSPPRHIVPQGRGNKYTPEDRDFFIRFISWRLKFNPSLTRVDLCEQLAEKVGAQIYRFFLVMTVPRLHTIPHNHGHLIGRIIMIFLIKY